MAHETRKPTVLVPYPGPCLTEGVQDYVFYLRPESNNVAVEGTLMRTLRKTPLYNDHIQMVYLVNLPGDFVHDEHLIELHQATKIRFAMRGKNLMTPWMQHRFESYFHVPFGEATILGSFEALRHFDMSYDELFHLRVGLQDFLKVHGQTIKRYQDTYILNYDIPAILHKNNNKTDFATMIFRSSLTGRDFLHMIHDMGNALIQNGIVDPNLPISRVFHFSKGPMEQVQDCLGFMYHKDLLPIPPEEISFLAYTLREGGNAQAILDAVKHPVIQYKERNQVQEINLFDATEYMDYRMALRFFQKVKSKMVQAL